MIVNDIVSLFANPGQTIRLSAQTLDGYGAAIDGYLPSVNKVLQPDLTEASGFPINMTKQDTGFYTHDLEIAQGSDSIGTFLVLISWVDPETGNLSNLTYNINVALPFGNSSVFPL